MQQERKPGYLLQGLPLIEAKQFRKNHPTELPLSDLASTFIQASIRQQQVNRLKTASWLVIPAAVAVGVVEDSVRKNSIKADYARLDSESPYEEKQAVQDLVKGCDGQRRMPWIPRYARERIFGNCRSLFQAPLKDASLSDANLQNADLSNADLSDANLQNAGLGNADLRGANLSSADLTFADLHNADLTGANLNFTILTSADFTGANITNAELTNADLGDANLRNANLRHTDLTGANLTFAELDNTNLINADLTGADLTGANLTDADLSNANLTNADLTFADLHNADLTNAFICRTQLPDHTDLDNKRDCKALGINPEIEE